MKILYDKFNSEIFQMQMGNIVDYPQELGTALLQQTVDRALDEGYGHLNVKVPVNYKRGGNVFLKFGFELVDTQLMYCLSNIIFLGGYRKQAVPI